MSDWRIEIGDCREVLRTLPDASAQCVVTSPPYWGLRDYGTARWEGGDQTCDHLQRAAQRNDSDRRGVESIWTRKGMVTSVDVLRQMELQGYGPELAAVDRRFLGALFRNGWIRIGYSPTGSHGRPVAIWRKA